MIEKNWKAVGLVLNYAQYLMILVLLLVSHYVSAYCRWKH